MSRRFDIGGPEVLTYVEMMQRYAAVAGLRGRVIVPVPLLTPRLPAHWVNVVTPVPAALAKPLVRSLVNEVVCRERDLAALVPGPPEGLLGFTEAVRLALQRVRDSAVETRWSSASWPGAPSDPLPTDPQWAGGSVYEDSRRAVVAAAPRGLWRVVEGIGGANGWYSFPLAWEVRGSSTGSSAASGCVADGATRSSCTSGRPSTSGASRRPRTAGCCGCGRR